MAQLQVQRSCLIMMFKKIVKPYTGSPYSVLRLTFKIQFLFCLAVGVLTALNYLRARCDAMSVGEYITKNTCCELELITLVPTLALEVSVSFFQLAVI